MINCAKCGGEMRLIPAGVSKKTGKPYQAFYSCLDRNCGGTAKADTPVKKFEQGLDQQNQDKKWEEISRGKVRHGFSIEAYKMGKELSLETKLEIDTWTNFVMNGK